jgi:FkbM family methyltransferase
LSGLLATNAVNNRLFNVEVVQAAGGASRRVVEFPNPPLNGRGNYGVLSLGSEGLETRPVAMIPLDDLAPDGAQIVKVDVEGYEAEVLKGAPRLLHESRPIWLVEARKDDPAVGDVISIFLAAGYSLHWFFAPFVTPRALKGAAPPSVGAGDSNIVALPPGAPNRWELPPVDPAAPRRPEAAEAYPYLGRYGYF